MQVQPHATACIRSIGGAASVGRDERRLGLELAWRRRRLDHRRHHTQNSKETVRIQYLTGAIWGCSLLIPASGAEVLELRAQPLTLVVRRWPLARIAKTVLPGYEKMAGSGAEADDDVLDARLQQLHEAQAV